MTEENNKFVDWVTSLAQAKANLPMIKDMAEVIIAEHETRAKCLRSYYLKLVEAGFKEDQALAIVKEHGWLGK